MSERQQTDAPIRRILLIQIRDMGDVLLTTPMIRATRQAFPDARIDYLVSASNATVLHGNPWLDEAIVWRRGVLQDARLLWKLLWRGYDAVIDMRSRPRTAVQTVVAGGRIRVGVRFNEFRDRWYTHLFPGERDRGYIARQKFQMLEPLGVHVPATFDMRLDLRIADDDRAWSSATLERVGLGGLEPIVAVSPVTTSRHKQWGAANWAAVADAIMAGGARVLITSGPGEMDQVRAVVERMKQRAVYDYGPTTIRQLAAMYEKCVVWVGNDGGAKHLAVAAGTPTISIGRWTMGDIWNDVSPGSGQQIVERLPVLPCDRNCGKCPHLSCLEQITHDDVVSLVRDALAKRVEVIT